ncbi:MAG: hypothetical protein ABF511_10285, partial [Lentilactobacillus hilgardii]
NGQKQYEAAAKAIGNDFNGYVAQQQKLKDQMVDLQKQQTTLQQQRDAINQQIMQLTNGTTTTNASTTKS